MSTSTEVSISELSTLLFLAEKTRDNIEKDVIRWRNRAEEARQQELNSIEQLQKWDRVVRGLEEESKRQTRSHFRG